MSHTVGTADFAHVARSSAIVRYSQVWEDADMVRKALAVTEDDDVLSIGGAGCNVLALLLDRPRRITAIDVNPAQSALVELKIAAVRTLSHEEYVCLVGARTGPDRAALYRRVREGLSEQARGFWDARPGDLAEGVMHVGRLERYVQRFRRDVVSRLIPDTAVARLLDLDDREAQQALFDRHFDTPEFRTAFADFFCAQALAQDGRDPTQFVHADDAAVPEMLWNRFRYACTEMATRGNFYLEYLLTSTIRDPEQGPPHLRPACFERLRGLVDRVDIVTEGLSEHLDEVVAGRYSKANLSDLFEYLSPARTDALFESLARVVRPTGRICFWKLFVSRAPAAGLRSRLTPRTDLAATLWKGDRAFFYRDFHVEERIARDESGVR